MRGVNARHIPPYRTLCIARRKAFMGRRTAHVGAPGSRPKSADPSAARERTRPLLTLPGPVEVCRRRAPFPSTARAAPGKRWNSACPSLVGRLWLPTAPVFASGIGGTGALGTPGSGGTASRTAGRDGTVGWGAPARPRVKAAEAGEGSWGRATAARPRPRPSAQAGLCAPTLDGRGFWGGSDPPASFLAAGGGGGADVLRSSVLPERAARADPQAHACVAGQLDVQRDGGLHEVERGGDCDQGGAPRRRRGHRARRPAPGAPPQGEARTIEPILWEFGHRLHGQRRS